MRVRFLPVAAQDLDRLYAAHRDPASARRLSDRIWQAIFSLEHLPEIGRVGRVRGTRELVVAGYIVTYVVDRVRAEVLILSVEHGAGRR
jgi:plasmid stabilization system protein ParE